ncbi:leucyl aminopeptidase [Halobacillus amylolyticus]|uniref:Probable cytosol aminopeptidase n=1 Tax=Halobacillus amylolyticus TaxID=2932259 RepID=A0ABY4HBQ6_9BACI|nr:leucyl aminopeptidase [Halobacillus amylolyticus]UOR11833.1 leucyl aminopeptidase [Halobacillus amylolyticus]
MFTIRKTLFDQDHTLIVGLFDEDLHHQLIFQSLNKHSSGQVDTYVKEGDISTEYKHVSKYLSSGQLPVKRVYFLGLGKKGQLTRIRLKKAFGKLFKQIQADKIVQLSIALESFRPDNLSNEECAEIISEAMGTATYQLASFKRNQVQTITSIDSLTLISDGDEGILLRSLEKGIAFSKGVNKARHLVHLPANILTSAHMAKYAVDLADEYGFTAEILEKEQMEELGMGALLAVNQGSSEPPKMIVLKYQGLEEWTDVTAFVGKGITYDTGGYSIKSKTGMPGMKGDMGGAAAVLGAMETIGRLKPKQNVLAVIPSTDNMISGSAFKPDDVITSLSGRTIEVLNTDAEGRLALADGMTYAKQLHAVRIINVATLTGGMVTALGSWMTGALTNSEDFFKTVQDSGEKMGEPIWQLPYNEDYQAQVRKSSIADLNNSPTRKAHPIMGGAFVGEFAEDTPWVHLDIAGTSTAEAAHDLGPKGPTGVMSRTLADYILTR